MKEFLKPKHVDYNLVVIGAGSAGLVAAYIGASARARVALIEDRQMGGDCLNSGCVPSKALIRSAKLLSQAKRATDYGFNSITVDFDFARIMERVQRVIKTIEPHDSIDRYTSLGVDCLQGHARITSPWCVEVNGRPITTSSIIIASGAEPYVPPVPGIDGTNYLTSNNVWSLRKLPERLLVMGGGPIGTELAQCFARFGSRVTQIEMLPRILTREDSEISGLITERLQQEGVKVLVNHQLKSINNNGTEKIALCEVNGNPVEIVFDELLVAVGRKARTENYGLEDLEIPLTAQGTISTDPYMRTCYKNIFACGDVAGPYQFTHTAAHQAWYATVNALLGGIWKIKADYTVIPWATFTDPEVARVGLNEQQAREKNIPYEVTTYDLADLDRAITDETATGLVKVLTVPGKDRILGATIVGDHAGDLITEYISAMRNNYGMNRILATIHIYPTLAEANKFTAGNWKKAHAPEFLLNLLKNIHQWRRGG